VKSVVSRDRRSPLQLIKNPVFVLIWAFTSIFAEPSRAAELKPETVRSWDQYIQWPDAGTPSEHEQIPGNDRGFLWRLVSWWRFEQIGGDVVIELESASLSRDIPAMIKFMPGICDSLRIGNI
jgi:hypothetical protein